MFLSNNKDKVLYRTHSFYAESKLMIGRLVLAVLIISGLLHFEENPVIITVLVAIMTVMLLYAGNENIIVYENRFVYQYGSLLKSLTWRRTFFYCELEQVFCEGIFTKGLDVLTDSLPIAVDPYNRIDIVFANGKSMDIHSRIHKQELKQVIEAIALQLNKVNNKKAAANASFPK